jgi:hypothetical protein
LDEIRGTRLKQEGTARERERRGRIEKEGLYETRKDGLR